MNYATASQYLNHRELSAAGSPPARCENHDQYALLESLDDYSIVVNLLGTARENIAIDVNTGERQVVVGIRKQTPRLITESYWSFGVATDGDLARSTANLRNGVLEIKIPKSLRLAG